MQRPGRGDRTVTPPSGSPSATVAQWLACRHRIMASSAVSWHSLSRDMPPSASADSTHDASCAMGQRLWPSRCSSGAMQPGEDGKTEHHTRKQSRVDKQVCCNVRGSALLVAQQVQPRRGAACAECDAQRRHASLHFTHVFASNNCH